jgi:sugar/nucleoside kinase (ribokinase family)
MNPELITIGSCTLDCIIEVDDILRFELFDKDVVKKYTAIEYSRKLNIENLRFVPGGSGANIAADCAMLGIRSAYVGVLGKDFSAQICIDDLNHRNVDLKHITQTEEDNTAFSVILKTEWGKDRSILAFKGANNLLTPEHVEEEFFSETHLFAWSSLTTENGCKAIQKSITITKNNGGLVFAAPSMSILKHNPKWAKILIANSDVVSMNAEEAEELTGEPERYYAIKKILDLGPKTVSITDGARGSLVTDGNKIIKSGIYDVAVKDTTGAGDAFLSGILLSKLKGYSLKKMIQISTAMSSLESMEVGVREGLPSSLAEIEDFISKNSLKQEVSNLADY